MIVNNRYVIELLKYLKSSLQLRNSEENYASFMNMKMDTHTRAIGVSEVRKREREGEREWTLTSPGEENAFVLGGRILSAPWEAAQIPYCFFIEMSFQEEF